MTNMETNLRVIKEKSVRGKATAEALQHPATLLFLAVCAVSGLYLIVLSPILGESWAAATVAGITGIGASVSFIRQYSREYPRIARELAACIDLENVRTAEAEIAQFGERLRVGFSDVNSSEGAQVLSQLTDSYVQLQQTFLTGGWANDPLTVSVIPALAGETYRNGLSVLSEALYLMKIRHNPKPYEVQGTTRPTEYQTLLVMSPEDSRERVVQDIEQLAIEIKTLNNDPSRKDQLLLNEEMLVSARQRLEMIDDLQVHIERLLHQAWRCELSLVNAQIELAMIRASDSKSRGDSIIESLQFTIRQVKEVQDEIDGMNRVNRKLTGGGPQ